MSLTSNSLNWFHHSTVPRVLVCRETRFIGVFDNGTDARLYASDRFELLLKISIEDIFTPLGCETPVELPVADENRDGFRGVQARMERQRPQSGHQIHPYYYLVTNESRG